MSLQRNVLGGVLRVCCKDPVTGFFRNGLCETDEEDVGQHTICVKVTEEFLSFSKQRGNDLITPMPEYDFRGLKSGDCWCVCALRWKEALEAGFAAPIKLESCHESLLKIFDLETLKKWAV